MIPTIYALATPPGRGALAVIRLSGTAVTAALTTLMGRVPPARQAALTKLIDPKTGQMLDQALVTYFKGPSSFTGEDTAELSLHGGLAVVAGIMDVLAALPDLRLAEPGEFTKRAFLNHKLDLTEAEAVADLIHAETSLQRAQALGQLNGNLKNLYDAWRDRLIKARAYLEAHLDFADEDIPSDLIDQIRPTLIEVQTEIARHLDDGNRGERLREGLSVVILGAPNAGKSSLLNTLAQRDVAIVSALAGTTRDMIDVHLDVGGYPITLTDTAGLRAGLPGTSAHDLIEAEGIKRAIARAGAADLKIVMFDAALWPDLDVEARAQIDDQTLVVLNKVDLAPETPDQIDGQNVIKISAQAGTGIDDLLAALRVRLGHLMGAFEGATLTRARHRAALTECAEAVQSALMGGDVVLMAEDLRAALHALGRLTGRVDVEDLLDVIFRDFCIGK